MIVDELDRGPQESIPPLAEVAAAYHDIDKFNTKHAGMARVLATLFSGEVEIADDDAGVEKIMQDDGSVVSTAMNEAVGRRMTEAESHQMESLASVGLQELFHDGTFAAIGVEVTDVSQDGSFTFFGPRTTADELKPVVADSERYVEFLSGLDKDEVQSDAKNLALPMDVIRTLERVVRRGYGELDSDSEKGDDHRSEVLWAIRTFAQIEQECERLGLDRPELYQQILEISDPNTKEWGLQGQAQDYFDTYDRLESYVTYSGRGVLSEYMEVGDELNVGPQPGYFKLGITDELVAGVDRILSLQHEDRTRKFGAEVARAKFQSLTQTLQAMRQPEHKDIATRQNRRLIRDQLDRLRPYV